MDEMDSDERGDAMIPVNLELVNLLCLVLWMKWTLMNVVMQ